MSISKIFAVEGLFDRAISFFLVGLSVLLAGATAIAA
jgi:hypothetical protein